MVRSKGMGGDILDHQVQFTPWHVQITRSATVKPRGVVWDKEKSVWNMQHGTSTPINNTATGRKPNKAR